jgi:phage terminase large subunit
MNDVFYPALFDETRFLNLMGGSGSGKSWFCAQKVIYRIITEPVHRFYCIRKVRRTLKSSVFSLLRGVIDMWGLTDLFDVNKSDLELIYKPNGSAIFCIGCDDPEKLKSMDRPTGFWCEEPTELDEADLLEINRRIRGQQAQYKQILLSYNPISYQHWLRKMFFQPDALPDLGVLTDSIRPRAKILRTTYLQNQFLDEEDREEMERLRHENFQLWRVYANAEWGVLKGLVFDPPTVVEAHDWPSEFDRVFYGIDFGWHDPATFVSVGICGDRDMFVEELIYESHLRTDQFGKRCLEIYQDRPRGLISADSANPEAIDVLKGLGLPVTPVKKGKGSVMAGIDHLKTFNIHVHAASQNLVGELGTYVWKRKGGDMQDEPVDYRNHAIDAWRYAATGGKRRRMPRILSRASLGV